VVRERSHISSACQEAREQEREPESERVGPSQRALHSQHTNTLKSWGRTVRQQGSGREGGREGGRASGRRERKNEGRRDMCGMKPTTRPNTTKITPALIAINFVFMISPIILIFRAPPPFSYESRSFSHTRACTRTHTYTNTYSHTQTHTHARTHAHAHAHSHTHTLLHIRTHSTHTYTRT